MRVLFVGNRFPPDGTGGYELHCQATRDYFQAQGDEVRVLVGVNTRASSVQSLRRSRVGRQVRAVEYGVFRDLRRSPWPATARGPRAAAIEWANARALSRHLREFRPHVVVWWRLAELSLSLVERVRLAGLPAVGVIGDGWLHEGADRDAWLSFAQRRPGVASIVAGSAGWPLTVDYGGAADWIFVSSHLQAHAKAQGIHLPRSRVIAPGLDPVFAAEGENRRADDEWSWRICFAGRLTASKGPDLAIRALALMPDEARLDVYGEGDAAYEAGLRELVRALGLTSRVRFHGAVSRPALAAAFARADVLLFPNRWTEPFGLVPLEAMAARLPVVAVPTGGAAEYLSHEINALLVREAEAESLASTVCRLARQPQLRASLTAGAGATARRYSVLDSGSGVRGAVEEVISASRHRARSSAPLPLMPLPGRAS